MTVIERVRNWWTGTDPDAAERMADHAEAIRREHLTAYQRAIYFASTTPAQHTSGSPKSEPGPDAGLYGSPHK